MPLISIPKTFFEGKSQIASSHLALRLFLGSEQLLDNQQRLNKFNASSKEKRNKSPIKLQMAVITLPFFLFIYLFFHLNK